MSSGDYKRDDLIVALRGLGLQAGDLIFSHSNVGLFGVPEGGLTRERVFETVLGAFLEVLGPEGTLVVPTFTYSFSRGRPYDPVVTPSDCGMFTEMLRGHQNAIRSHEPNVSVAAIGRLADALTRDLPEDAYGENSFFDRFSKRSGLICNLNFDAGSTFVHYVEKKLKIPYRFDKIFEGVIKLKGKEENRSSSLWVRDDTSEDTVARFELFDELARKGNLYRVRKVGKGFVGVISSASVFELIEKTLPEQPWFLTQKGQARGTA